MTIKRLLRLVRSMYPTEFEDEVLLLWLSQCENTLLTEVMLLSVADCTEYTEANDATLLVPHPYDKLYLPYMQAMICQANGETDKYMNHMQVYNAYRDEYARWVCATISPAYGEAIQNGYYLSAYSIAQAHGYSGTVEEWLTSLKGPEGERGKDGKPGLNGVGADPKYSAVLQQLFEDGNAGFPYTEEDHEGNEPYSYGAAMLLRTEAEKKNYGSVTMPSTGKVVELIREHGSGWVDVTEDFLTQQKPPEEYLRMQPQGQWQLFYESTLRRAEIVENAGGKHILLTTYTDDPFFYAEMYVDNERVFRFDSEIGEAELFGEKVWTGEGGRTYVGTEEPVGAPDGSLWVVHPTESKPKGISLYYAGENEADLKNAPNGSVRLAPKSSNKPAVPDGGSTEETDPTVPAWAKQPNKPTYTAKEIGAATPEDITEALANLPTGGDKWEFIGEFNVGKADVAEWWITEDAEGKPVELKQMYIEIDFLPSAATTADTKVFLSNPAVKHPFRTNCEFYENTWVKTTEVKHQAGKGLYIDYLPLGEEMLMRATQQVALYTARVSVGLSSEGEGVSKQCFAGLAMKVLASGTGRIGANSTIKMWGTRI